MNALLVPILGLVLLLQKGKEIGVEYIQGPVSFTSFDNARDIDLTGSYSSYLSACPEKCFHGMFLP
jgi:hypothetical protein